MIRLMQAVLKSAEASDPIRITSKSALGSRTPHEGIRKQTPIPFTHARLVRPRQPIKTRTSIFKDTDPPPHKGKTGLSTSPRPLRPLNQPTYISSFLDHPPLPLNPLTHSPTQQRAHIYPLFPSISKTPFPAPSPHHQKPPIMQPRTRYHDHAHLERTKVLATRPL